MLQLRLHPRNLDHQAVDEVTVELVVIEVEAAIAEVEKDLAHKVENQEARVGVLIGKHHVINHVLTLLKESVPGVLDVSIVTARMAVGTMVVLILPREVIHRNVDLALGNHAFELLHLKDSSVHVIVLLKVLANTVTNVYTHILWLNQLHPVFRKKDLLVTDRRIALHLNRLFTRGGPKPSGQ